MAHRFSIVVLARNEARTLPRLLSDLAAFVESGGELLVVDTGSSDETISIARAHGCRVEEVGPRFDTVLDGSAAAEIERRIAAPTEGPLVGAGQRMFHFGEARNHAGQLARCDFVLQLDASDRVPALDVGALDGWIASGGVGAFEYEQEYGSIALRISRFYDRRRYRWEGRVHEILVARAANTVPPPPLRLDPQQILVRHHKQEDKPRNYLAGLALQVLEWPQRPRWWHYLGRELFYQCWYRSAIAVLQAHAAMENAWAPERSQSLSFAGECFEALGRAGEAMEVVSARISARCDAPRAAAAPRYISLPARRVRDGGAPCERGTRHSSHLRLSRIGGQLRLAAALHSVLEPVLAGSEGGRTASLGSVPILGAPRELARGPRGLFPLTDATAHRAVPEAGAGGAGQVL